MPSTGKQTSHSNTTSNEIYNISRSRSSSLSLSSINIMSDEYIPKVYNHVLSPIHSLNDSPFSVFDERNSPIRQLRMSPLAVAAHAPKIYMTNAAFSKTHAVQLPEENENTSNIIRKIKRCRSS